jgi:HNH endonuclease
MTLEQLLARLGETPAKPATGPGSAGPAAPPWPWNRTRSQPPGPVLRPAAPPGADCDATIIPIVTGRLDHALLDQLASKALGADGSTPDRAGLRDLIARHATALLSGPDALTSWLRTRTLPPPASAVSLPLDVGTATDTIPAHLRRAVISRDRHCAYPGCTTPPAGCQVHHITPRKDGGPTKLTNLLLLCTFHHLILIHRWHWSITLNADGTTTARSPDGRILRSHSPPQPAAA